MLDAKTRKAVQRAIKEHKKAQEKEQETKKELVFELQAAHLMAKASYAELGLLLGVSRQRVHRLLKGE